ncbi:MAG TPA: TolC family protein [Planctomycetota bacterium]|nr:TolC family protein [Planctomycetota bacterium]
MKTASSCVSVGLIGAPENMPVPPVKQTSPKAGSHAVALVLCVLAVLSFGECRAEEVLFQDPTTTTPATEVTNRPKAAPAGPAAAPAETAAEPKKEEAAPPKPKPQEESDPPVRRPAAQYYIAPFPNSPEIETASPNYDVFEDDLPLPGHWAAMNPDKNKLVPLGSILNPEMPEEEKPLFNLIQESIKTGGAGRGVRMTLKTRKLQEISTRTAAMQALDRTLAIQLQAHDAEFRRNALQEARAVFLPVFSVGPRFDNTNTFERKEELTLAQKIARQQVKFFRTIPGGENPTTENPDPEVLGQNFFQQGEIQFVDPKDKKSFYILTSATDAFGQPTQVVVKQDLTKTPADAGFTTLVAEGGGVAEFLRDKKLGYVDPQLNAKKLNDAWNYNVASKRKAADPRGAMPLTISQQLPWGPVLNITQTVTYRNKAYDRFGHNFDRPWFSNFNVNAFIPLPGTKNFGPYAPQDVGIKLAKIEVERSLWDLKAIINSTLLSVELRYLNLVNALKNLESTLGNRKTIELLQKNTADMLERGRVTAYGKDQIDAELLRVRTAEEAAWQNYVLASNALVDILNTDPDTLLVPVGYSRMINEHAEFNAADAVKVGLATRPELKSDTARVRSAEVFLRFQKQQSRPDITVSASVTFDQTQLPNSGRFRGETGIGYRVIGDSLVNTFNEDSRNESYTFNFRRQMFQRAEHARIHIAQHRLEQQLINSKITVNSVVQSINDALAGLDSAKARVDAARARLDASVKAYNATADLHREGRITEFEVVSKNQDRLDAEFGLNAAQVAYKAAEVQLLFAMGTLPAEYPERTSPTAFDRYRLGLLKASSALHFFGDGKEEKAK